MDAPVPATCRPVHQPRTEHARVQQAGIGAQAQDDSIPLLERLRFLCITCTNLDEFFEIRVAALKQRMEIGALAQGPEMLPAQQVFDVLRIACSTSSPAVRSCSTTSCSRSLTGLRRRFRAQRGLDAGTAGVAATDYFTEQVVPVLTPLTFDPSRRSRESSTRASISSSACKGKDAYRAAASSRHGAGAALAAAHHPSCRNT